MTTLDAKETGSESESGLRRGPRQAETAGAVNGISGVQIGLLLLLLLLNLLVLWFLWGIVSAT